MGKVVEVGVLALPEETPRTVDGRGAVKTVTQGCQNLENKPWTNSMLIKNKLPYILIITMLQNWLFVTIGQLAVQCIRKGNNYCNVEKLYCCNGKGHFFQMDVSFMHHFQQWMYVSVLEIKFDGML